MVRQGGSYMRVCGVNLRCGSLYDSNPIKIHYLCFINMFTLSLSLSLTHTHKFLKKIAHKYGDDVRMTGYLLTYLLTYLLHGAESFLRS